MPQVQRQCDLCSETEPPPKPCSSCKNAWYCSMECQKYDRVRHIFDCHRSRPITTADHLALAAQRDLMPEHPQTCVDYGFAGADQHTQVMLLGLYIGLLDPHRIGVKPYTLHKWRVKGPSTLVENIKKEFEKWPENSRGGYYAWFVQNQDVLGVKQDPLEREAQMKSQVGDWVRRAWCFIGRPPTASAEQILRWRQSISPDLQNCFSLYAMLLAGSHPGPSIDIWITFGFCACESQESEMVLAQQYLQLMHKTTFNDFSTAYKSSSLISFFKDNGIPITNPCILDILSSPFVRKSVWDLKQYIENKTINGSEDTETLPANSVLVDYGFFNCGTAKEHDMLFDVYKRFFALKWKTNPVVLHKACIEGRLFAYFANELKFQLAPRKEYQRLLKNFYPLPMYAVPSHSPTFFRNVYIFAFTLLLLVLVVYLF